MSIRNAMLIACVAAASACGGEDTVAACEAYIDAASACIDEAYGDDTTSSDAAKAALEGVCDPYDGNGTAEASAYFDCLADAYAAGDCSDSTTYASIDISGCTL